MGISFRKSLNLGNGFRLNLSKSGVSISGGVKGLRVNVGLKGIRVSSTKNGISYQKSISWKKLFKSVDLKEKEVS